MTAVISRRKGTENSVVRAQLLECAVEILREEGVDAVTARRLADRVGLGRHIVHYYFGTLDELFVAVMREEGARSEDMMREAAQTGDAIDLLFDSILQSAAVIFELMKLAIRHPSIAREYKVYTDRFRLAMAEVLEAYARTRGITLPTSPAATAMLLQSMATSISIEASLGVEMGHRDAESALLDWLKQLK
jgi:AcrR family transcriptional regulator